MHFSMMWLTVDGGILAAAGIVCSCWHRQRKSKKTPRMRNYLHHYYNNYPTHHSAHQHRPLPLCGTTVRQNNNKCHM